MRRLASFIAITRVAGFAVAGAVVVSLAMAVATVAAQAPPPAPPNPDDLRPAEVQRLFDAYIVVQVQDALKLTDDQFSRVLPRLRLLQQVRRQSQQDRLKLVNDLQRLTNPKLEKPTEEAILKERLDALQELDSRTAAELRRAYDGVDEILDIPQRARFRVFEEQVERRKLQLLLRARQARPPQTRQQR
jgi:hypothetical protein